MRSFFLQPYPFSDHVGRKLLVCAGVGLFITLFLVVFQPFGFEALPVATRWKHAVLFGLVTFVVSAFMQVGVPKFFPSVFREAAWRSWKEIVYLLLTTLAIGAANYGLMLNLYPQRTDLASFLQAELITLQVGIFPVCFIVFMKQMTLYRSYATQAKEVSDDIRQDEAPAPINSPVHERPLLIKGENQKEELSVLPNDLLVIASADNYVRAHWQKGPEVKSVLLRGTLKRMEEQVAAHPQFFRCHRMYVVNLARVAAVSGNAQGLKLHLSGLEETVPVSRSLTETVKERLHELSRSPRNA